MMISYGFVLLLFGYHLKTHQIYKELQRDHFRYSSKFMRLFNEGSTLILFAVVFLVILKSTLNWIYATVGFFALIGMLMLGIKMYKRIRDKNPEA